MEKKEYTKPIIEVVDLTDDFIITTSNTSGWNDDEDIDLDDINLG